MLPLLPKRLKDVGLGPRIVELQKSAILYSAKNPRESARDMRSFADTKSQVKNHWKFNVRQIIIIIIVIIINNNNDKTIICLRFRVLFNTLLDVLQYLLRFRRILVKYFKNALKCH